MATSKYFQCRTCRERLVLRFGTDGKGRLVETRDPCRCERGTASANASPPVPASAGTDDDKLSDAERSAIARYTGTCMDCSSPVAGHRGKALRCAHHKREARRASDRRHHAANREQAAREYAEYARRPEVKRRRAEKRRARYAAMKQDPEKLAQFRRVKQKEHSVQHPSYSRRIEYFNRYNASNREKRREAARERYYRLHPERPAPVCATCTRPIEWDGRGRPSKYHLSSECHPNLPGVMAKRRAAEKKRAARTQREGQDG